MIEKKKRLTDSNRSDKKKNISKVLKTVIKEPLSNYREIAKKTWLSLGSVSAQMKDIEQNWTKIPEIQEICENDFNILKLVQKETSRRLQSPEFESFTDIIRAWAESAKRYTIFKWSITDEKWGLKEVNYEQLMKMTPEQLKDYRKQFID